MAPPPVHYRSFLRRLPLVLSWVFTTSPALAQDPPPAEPAPTAPTTPAAPTAPPASPPTPPAVPPAPPEVPEEVSVRGARRDIGNTKLTATDVRQMPGAFGDPFRAIEALPGVIPVVSGLPFFYIRGAPPNDNGYLVDGIRVPLLFHVGVGEGVIHPALVDHIDFYPGAPPASYGGFAGAIIAGQTREPATTPHAEANLRLVDAGALVETPFADGRGSLLAAGRYGYPGPILGLIDSSDKLGYWDYQARATWRLDNRDAVGVFAFGSHDYLGTSQNGATVEQLGSDFHRVDLRYDRDLDDGHLRVAATLGHDVQGGGGGNDGQGPAIVTDLSAALRAQLDQKLATGLRLRAGADARIDAYGFSLGTAPPGSSGGAQPPVPSSADPPPTNVSGGAYADVVWRMAPRVEVVPGLRAGFFESTRGAPAGADGTTLVPAFDPRLAVRVTLAPTVAWLSTFGIVHQYPALRVGPIPALILTVPGFPAGDGQLQTALQASQGIEVALPADFVLAATGFLSGWSGLTDLTAQCIQIMPPTTPPPSGPPPSGSAGPPNTPWVCPNGQPVHGRAFGGELLVRRPLSKRLTGWLSYTLSRSTRDESFVTLSGTQTQASVVSDYDRTHVLNAVAAYDLGRGWRAGARFVFYTGTPYSNLSGNVPVPPYNAYRTPPFFRADVRLEKRWAVGQGHTIAFVLEGQNVTLSKEDSTMGLSCQGIMNNKGGTTQCTYAKIGPLTIPSVGVEALF